VCECVCVCVCVCSERYYKCVRVCVLQCVAVCCSVLQTQQNFQIQ